MSWIGCWIWSCSITGIHSFNSDRCLTRPSENLYEFTPNSSAGETRICLRKLGWGVSSTKGRGAGLGEAASGRQGAVFPRRAHGAPSGAGRAQCRPLHPERARGPGVPASSRSPRGPELQLVGPRHLPRALLPVGPLSASRACWASAPRLAASSVPTVQGPRALTVASRGHQQGLGTRGSPIGGTHSASTCPHGPAAERRLRATQVIQSRGCLLPTCQALPRPC